MRYRGWFAALFLVLLVASIGGAAPAANAQESGMSFTAEPSRSSRVADDGYFVFRGHPGRTYRDALEIRNVSDETIQVRVTPVAARTGLKGGVDYGEGTEGSGTAAWISVPSDRLQLTPGETRDVPFIVVVPAVAPGGVNLAGLAVSVPGEQSVANSGSQDGDLSLTLQTRRVIAVQVDLPGGAGSSLDVTGVNPLYLPSGPHLEIVLENTGSTMFRGSGVIEVDALDVKEAFSFDTFVPGTTLRYPIRLAVVPSEGTFPTTIHLDFGAGTADWSGELVIGNEMAEELVDRGALPTPDPRSLPLWPTAIALAVVLAGGIASGMRLSRRHPER